MPLNNNWMKAVNIPVRPLNKGMFRDRSSNLIEPGGFWDIVNFRVRDYGLKRRGGLKPLQDVTSIDITEPIIDIFVADSGGERETLLLTENRLFKFDPDGYEEKVPASGTGWIGYKSWHASHTYLPGSYDKVIITAYAADGLYEYSSAGGLDLFTLTGSITDSTPAPFSTGRVITHFADRLWVGNVTEGGIQQRRRIYWSEPGKYDVFLDQNYVDLPDSEGELVALKQLGTLLVAYFEDSIYLGRPTSLIGLPYKFERFDASDLGLVSNKAVVSWIDGHFLVLNDDIYYFSNTLSLQPIGSQIKDLTVLSPENKQRAQFNMIAPDVKNGDIIFFFPKADSPFSRDSKSANEVWRYHYKTTAWSRDEVGLNNIGNPIYSYTGVFSSYFYTLNKNWEDWQIDNPDSRWRGDSLENPDWETYRYWLDITDETLTDKTSFFHLSNGIKQGLYFESDDGLDTVFGIDGFIQERLESADGDVGLPDEDKTVNRISFKLKTFTDEAFNLTLYSSNNRGRTFRREGLLRFLLNEDEGRVDYLSTGSNMRFKLIGSSTTERQPYELMEYVVRLAGRGLQTDDI